MTPLLIIVALAVGFILGMACVIAIVTAAGYVWSDIMHSWYIGLVYLRHKSEIDAEISEDVRQAGESGVEWVDSTESSQ